MIHSALYKHCFIIIIIIREGPLGTPSEALVLLQLFCFCCQDIACPYYINCVALYPDSLLIQTPLSGYARLVLYKYNMVLREVVKITVLRCWLRETTS